MKWNAIAASAVVLAVLILGVAGHIMPAQAQRAAAVPKTTTAEAWQTFTGPEGDFKVNLPGKPIRTADSPGPVTVVRSFDLETVDGMFFSVSLTDAGGDPRSRENNVLGPDAERLLIEEARARGQEIIQTRRLTRNSIEIEMRWPKPAGNGIHNLTRQTLRRGRLYSLLCGSTVDGKDVDRSVCRRFFNSLRFAK
jgi:hypothetical protein